MWRQLLLPLTHTDVKEIGGGCWRSLCWQLSPTALSTDICTGEKEAHHHCIPQVPSLAFYCFFSLSLPYVPSHSLFSLPSLVGILSPAPSLFPHLFWCLPKFPRSSSTHCPTQQKVFCLMGCPRLSCDILLVPSLHFRGWLQGQPVQYCKRNGLDTLLSVTEEIWDIHSQQ